MNKYVLPLGLPLFAGIVFFNALLTSLIIFFKSGFLTRAFYGAYGISENLTLFLYFASIVLIFRVLFYARSTICFFAFFHLLVSVMVIVLETHLFGISEMVETIWHGLPPRPTLFQMLIVSGGRLFFALVFIYGVIFLWRFRIKIYSLFNDRKERSYLFYISVLVLCLIASFIIDVTGVVGEPVEEMLEINAASIWLIFSFVLNEGIKQFSEKNKENSEMENKG